MKKILLLIATLLALNVYQYSKIYKKQTAYFASIEILSHYLWEANLEEFETLVRGSYVKNLSIVKLQKEHDHLHKEFTQLVNRCPYPYSQKDSLAIQNCAKRYATSRKKLEHERVLFSQLFFKVHIQYSILQRSPEYQRNIKLRKEINKIFRKFKVKKTDIKGSMHYTLNPFS